MMKMLIWLCKDNDLLMLRMLCLEHFWVTIRMKMMERVKLVAKEVKKKMKMMKCKDKSLIQTISNNRMKQTTRKTKKTMTMTLLRLKSSTMSIRERKQTLILTKKLINKLLSHLKMIPIKRKMLIKNKI